MTQAGAWAVDSRTGSPRLRVLTYNVLALQHASGSRRQEVARAGLAEWAPDVVALQEVTRTADGTQAAELLGEEFTVVDHPGFSPDGVGACLASRLPLRHVGTLDLRVTHESDELPWAAAVAVDVTAPPPIGRVLVVHHKPSWQLDRERAREEQAVRTARWVEALLADDPDRPVVLLGDFDAAPDCASMRFWTGRQSLGGMSVRYEDAWEAVRPGEPGHTLTPRNALVRSGEVPLERGRRIDHVLVRSGAHGPPLDVARCDLFLDSPVGGVWASDHFGVLADLVLPPHAPGSWGDDPAP